MSAPDYTVDLVCTNCGHGLTDREPQTTPAIPQGTVANMDIELQVCARCGCKTMVRSFGRFGRGFGA